MAEKSPKEPKRNAGVPRRTTTSEKDFLPPPNLDGKTDSGPEPDVFGREIPPQDGEDESQ